jgi:DMSO/TMAO reductase YedYZ heme-binding membrane subunit
MATTRGYPRGQYPRDGVGAWNQEDAFDAWNDDEAIGTWDGRETGVGTRDRRNVGYGSPDRRQAGYGSPDRRQAGVGTQDRRQAGVGRREQERWADDERPQQRARNRVDEWMDGEFKFAGSRIKRKTLALVLIGAFGVLPLFFMLPALITLNRNTFSVSVDDTLGTGAEVCLFLCLLVSPMMLLTGQRWFFPLRRWFGIMMAASAIGDTIAAGLTDAEAGGFLSRITEHTFVFVGFLMVLLLLPLLVTANPWAQRKLGRYWKTLHRLIYVIWGLLFVHLALLEGFGFERENNGSGFSGDGDPVFHQRLYQYMAASLFLLTLRLPPVKRWIAARQQEGRNKLVWLVITPIFLLFVFGMIFILNELFFKGINSFNETPSNE